MPHTNIEIKAKTSNHSRIRQFLLQQGADFRGTDFQTDTYFKVPFGRLKLRQGNIENSLIFYERENIPGPKQSDFDLATIANDEEVKAILGKALGIKTTVKKSREIYYIRNVKFHLDTLFGFGEFVEIEATNIGTDISVNELREQCQFYLDAFDITENDLLPVSYSDMLLAD